MIAVIGTALADIYTLRQKSELAHDAKYAFESHRAYPGGKAANQAAAVVRLGGSSLLVTRIGKDEFGTAIKEALLSDGVESGYVFEDPREPTGFVILIPSAKDSLAAVVSYGASAYLGNQDIEKAKEAFVPCSVYIISLEIQPECVLKTLSITREQNRIVIIDPYPPERADTSLLTRANIITPNRDEAESITGRTIDSIFSAKLAVEELLKAGIEKVCLKLGPHGIVIGDGEFIQHIHPPLVSQVDATAGGDVFVAALSVTLERGWEFENAATFATYASALTVTRPGSYISMPFLSEVLEFIKLHEKNKDFVNLCYQLANME